MSAKELKTQIAHCFGAASSSYDSSARLQRRSGSILLEMISHYRDANEQPKTIVDLGCGTGYFSELMQPLGHHVIGVDLSKSMLRFAKKQRSEHISWLAGDVHQFPLADNSVDIIFSNLVIQWCDPLSLTFAEINRVLKPGGKVVFATLLDGTLTELKESWATVDDDTHVIDFKTIDEIKSCIDFNTFDVEQLTQSDIVLPYQHVKHLALELKSLGASTVPNKRNKGLGGKTSWKNMCAAYQDYRDDLGNYPATYQLCTAALIKKAPME